MSTAKVRLNVLLKKQTVKKLKQTKENQGQTIGWQIDKALEAK